MAWFGLLFGLRRVEVLEGAGEPIAAARKGDSSVGLRRAQRLVIMLLLAAWLLLGQRLFWCNEDVDIVGLVSLLLRIQALKALRDKSTDVQLLKIVFLIDENVDCFMSEWIY